MKVRCKLFNLKFYKHIVYESLYLHNHTKRTLYFNTGTLHGSLATAYNTS